MIPISPELVISAIKALIRFRGRVDVILALKEATAELPFTLPPAPVDTEEHLDEMLQYFEGERGKLILELRGLTADFERVKEDPADGRNREARRRVFQLFYENSDLAPVVLGPGGAVDESRSVRVEPDMRLAYYVVSSHRLSRNPALTRLLLATADTLLEFFGENAGFFIKDEKTAAIVGTLIDEFAVKRDFDDDGAEAIFKSLLGAAILAASQHAGKLADKPALGALLGALADAREELGDDFVAKIITLDGFQKVAGGFLTHVADDPDFLPHDPRLRDVLSVTLKEIGTSFPRLLEDPSAILGVLETSLAAAAAQVESILEKKLGGKPLLAATLVAVVKEVESLGKENRLFKSIAGGEVLTGIFRATLATIAENPKSLGTDAAVSRLVSEFAGEVAGLLSHKALADVLTPQSLQEISARGLAVLARNTDALGIDSAFAAKVVTGVFTAAASAVVDGLELDDLEKLADAAIKSASANLHLLQIDGRLLAVLEALGSELSDDGIRKLLVPQERKKAILAVLQVVAANPAMWEGLGAAGLLQPAVSAVLGGLATDPTRLLAGPALVEAVRRSLLALARQGRKLIDEEVEAADIEKLLTLALAAAEEEVGVSIDGENLPEYVERVVRGFLRAPFKLTTVAAAEFKALTGEVIGKLEAA